MKLHFRSLVSIALSAALLLGCVGCGGAPKAATTITVWTYYSGDQLTSFNELVDDSIPPSGRKSTSWSKAPAKAA